MNKQKFYALCRKAAAQGAVLLKNEKEVLPLQTQDNVAVFGRCQIDYYRSGTGSGGSIHVPYTTNLLQSLMDTRVVKINEELAAQYRTWLQDNPFDDGGGGWACEPWCQQEMPVSYELAAQAAKVSNKALVVIGRTAGEDKDNAAVKGAYLLTDTETEMLRNVCAAFEDVTVILNVSNLIDMSFMDDPACSHIHAIVYAWQGGMEGGNGIADVLTGKETFQGRLTDTIAYHISDYPSDRNHGGNKCNLYQEDIYVGYRYFETFAKETVRYPFGYGLSYTKFQMWEARMSVEGTGTNALFTFSCVIKNVGTRYSGREVVQLYVEAPCGVLGRPARELIGFAKTKDIPCMSRTHVTITVPACKLAAYNDRPDSAYPNSYILEAGDYRFYAGSDVRNAVLISFGSNSAWTLEETILVRQCEEAMAPTIAFERMKANTHHTLGWESVPTQTIDLAERIRDHLPRELAYTGNKRYQLSDVAQGLCTMEDFIAQFADTDLAAIVRGEGMCSIKVTAGTAAAFGGVSDALLSYGVPIGCCADGPSGIRMDNGMLATQVPIGTLLACTWDEALNEELYTYVGAEMKENKIDALLGPGINIHRHPLNGRNFEYFSEDPLVTGKIAAAMTRGMERNGVYGTIKHLACNSQEKGRQVVDAVVSQRALREIYLKGFEIAVKEGHAKAIMTSYNPVNGHWTASNYDLTTTILRHDWGYTGIVMTDWWASMNNIVSGGAASRTKTADMIRAQNDIYMVVNNNGAEINAAGDDTMQALAEGRLTRGELQRSAMNLCSFLMHTHALARVHSEQTSPEHFASLDGQMIDQGQLQNAERITLNSSANEQLYFAITETGTYDVIFKIMSPHSDISQDVCKLFLNNKELCTFQTNGTNGNSILQKLQRVRMDAGNYELRLQHIKAGMVIETVEFRKVL